jgi:CheY-like chemotaxis protein
MSSPDGDATILVVEDNPDNRVIMQAWLEHAGYRVLLAGDGLTGIALARGEEPDVILMDVALPGMDGWNTAEQIKQCPETEDIPIIALTALTLPEDQRRAAEVGVDGYLAKPVALLRVLEEVERVLRG